MMSEHEAPKRDVDNYDDAIELLKRVGFDVETGPLGARYVNLGVFGGFDTDILGTVIPSVLIVRHMLARRADAIDVEKLAIACRLESSMHAAELDNALTGSPDKLEAVLLTCHQAQEHFALCRVIREHLGGEQADGPGSQPPVVCDTVATVDPAPAAPILPLSKTRPCMTCGGKGYSIQPGLGHSVRKCQRCEGSGRLAMHNTYKNPRDTMEPGNFETVDDTGDDHE